MRKKVTGTWFEFQHHNDAEGRYWNPLLKSWTEKQWRQYIRQMKGDGMEYLVLLATALHNRAYFDTEIYPKADMVCQNPLEVLMDEADKQGMKVFLSAGYYGNWRQTVFNMSDPQVTRRAFRAMEELCEKFGHFRSLYGWYLPDETCVNGYFSEEFIAYINKYAAQMRSLSKDYKLLAAPYGTRLTKPDDRYAAQLERIDADFIAYQDEIGVQKTRVEESAAFFEGLRRVHDRAGRSALWADVEAFEFEGPVYQSPLLPAPKERLERQLEAVSPYVDRILIYQYQIGLSDPKRGE